MIVGGLSYRLSAFLIVMLSLGLGLPSRSNSSDSTASTDQDDVITERIKTALLRDPDVRGYLVRVWVRQGTVILSGRVGSPFERSRAGDVASQVEGVLVLKNRLIDPTSWAWDSDVHVRERIERALGRHDRLSEQVGVTVTDGMATIQGTVPSAEAYRQVEELVLENGAFTVNNRLRIETQGEAAVQTAPP